MRKFSTWLGILGIAGCFAAANAWAQDADEAAPEAAPAVEAAPEAAPVPEAAPAVEAASEAAPAAPAVDKAALAAMDERQSFLYFIELLRACGNDPAYQAKPDHKSCSVDAIWESIDSKSKMLFISAYASLARVDRIIETYFDPIEYKAMRERTGTYILKEHNITDALGLFKYMFKPDQLVFNDQTNSGVEFKGIVRSNSPYIVTIETNLQGQDFVMVQESDKIWRMAGLFNILSQAVKPISDSEAAMQEYAKENLMAELKRRTKVRDYFIFQQKLRKKLADQH